jgi:hypothetical protein
LRAAIKKNTVCGSCRTKAQYIADPNKNKGNSNGRYGKKLVDLWNAKYDIEAVAEKVSALKNQLTIHGFHAGELNPMYGKAPPQNAGRSYKGWYKDIFFRSTLELSFLIKFEELWHRLPTSADSSKFRVKYVDSLGKCRTYIPDFVDEDTNTIFELKCDRFVNYGCNPLKHKAANEYFIGLGYKFQIVSEIDTGINSFDNYLRKLKKYVDANIVRLTDLSLTKLNKRLKIK